MPATKCSACNYRNFHTATTCINCGIALIPPESPRAELLTPLAANSARVKKEVPTRQSIAFSQPIKKSAVLDTQERLPAVPVQSEERLPKLFQQNAVDTSPMNINTMLSPYQSQLPEDASSFGSTIILDDKRQKSLATLQPLLINKYPWWFLGRPKLVGTIIHIQSDMQFPDHPNITRAFFDLLSEFIWMASNQPTHREGERVQVTVLRLRISDGTVRDARIMGNLRGANLSMGDLVSLWGWRLRGSLTIQRGYNHTSSAIITSNMMSMIMPAIIMFSIIGVILASLYNWSHILIAWSQFLVLWHHYFHSK